MQTKSLFATIVAGTVATGLMLGCQSDTKTASQGQANKDQHDDHDHHDHGHAEHGPHHGELIPIGNHKYHAEVVIDSADGKVTVYMLDDSVEEAVSVADQEPRMVIPLEGKTKEYRFTSAPQADDAEGVTTRFELLDKTLADALSGKAKSGAKFSVEIDGKVQTGGFEQCQHHHHGDDEDDEFDHVLVWRQKDIELAGHIIQLGHHGMVIHAGEAVEPAVTISHSGNPVGEAKVFATLVDDDGETVLVEEQAMKFKSATEDEAAHYAGGELDVPAETGQVVIRYRIQLPEGAGEADYDVRVNTESDE